MLVADGGRGLGQEDTHDSKLLNSCRLHGHLISFVSHQGANVNVQSPWKETTPL